MQIIIKYVCLCIIYGDFTVSSFSFRKSHDESQPMLCSLQEGEWVVTGETQSNMVPNSRTHSRSSLNNSRSSLDVFAMFSAVSCLTRQPGSCVLYPQASAWRWSPHQCCRRSFQFLNNVPYKWTNTCLERIEIWALLQWKILSFGWPCFRSLPGLILLK